MSELLLKLPNCPSECQRQEPAISPQNWKTDGRGRSPGSKETQFKSRGELDGRLDPRINVAGRPKIVKEETAEWLQEKDANGVTNARKMVEAMGALAQKQLPHSVSAFRELRQIAESCEGEQRNVLDAGGINMRVIEMIQRLATGTGEESDN